MLINGSPAGYFSSNKGIRQGDPLSPYIFVIVMEFWSIQMDLAMASGKLQPIKRSTSNHLSHLLFVDDMLIFCRANKSSLKELNYLLASLQLNTGLTINRSKS